jgi:ornithine cyclodeaminase/alanine dehydrogenase-like protein (mu-crystallin family)
MTNRSPVLYLTEDDVRGSITMAEAIELAERGVIADGEGRVAGDKFYMPVGPNGFVKPFAGYLEGEDLAFVKTFSFFEGNPARGLPATDSMVLLLSAETGLPVCIMEAGYATALKTGASTAVTARYLARPGARIAAVFGAGGLGRAHCEALDMVLAFDEIRVIDVVPEAAHRLAADMGGRLRAPLRVCDGPRDAVEGADVIVTVTTGSAVNVEPDWVAPGAFVARLGSYQEVSPELFLTADRFVVDRWEYVSHRIPEMIRLIADGRMSRDDVDAEWPEIAAGKATGRRTPGDVILYVALGVWGEYAAILPQVYRNAVARGLGRPVPGPSPIAVPA